MNQIHSYAHCAKCIEEFKRGLAPGQSPGEYARLEAGMTAKGFQLRCARHDMDVVHFDFRGHKVDVVKDDTTAPPPSMSPLGEVEACLDRVTRRMTSVEASRFLPHVLRLVEAQLEGADMAHEVPE